MIVGYNPGQYAQWWTIDVTIIDSSNQLVMKKKMMHLVTHQLVCIYSLFFCNLIILQNEKNKNTLTSINELTVFFNQ